MPSEKKKLDSWPRSNEASNITLAILLAPPPSPVSAFKVRIFKKSDSTTFHSVDFD